MTQLISQRRGPKPAFLLLVLLALVAAGLFGTTRLGSSAQAQTTVPLHESQEGTEHMGNTQTCPTPPAGQEGWFGWHFVMPSNENFTSLSVEFATAGTITADPFPGAFVSHPDASHAYIWTETADTLLSGTSTTEATEPPAFFNLSGTCAPTAEPTGGSSSVTIVKEGLLGDDVASFTHNLDETGTFDLGGANPTSVTFTDIEAGEYQVTELPLEGYVLESGGCQIDTARSAPSLTTVEGNTINVTVGEDQDITCTFINGPADTVQHTVTITKYIDDALATDGVFNLTATWTAANLNGGVQTSGDFTLGAPEWTAVTSLMDEGADYSVVENGIDATCEGEDAYSLAGYGIGGTLEEAAAAEPVAEASFTDLQADMYVVVFNESCAQHTVTITKYIDDALATEGVFDLTATWTAANLNGGVESSGNFTLEAPDWMAVTSLMAAGADYSVVENGIDATCEGEDAYSLAGFGIGETLEEAAAAAPVEEAAITDLQADMYVVVFNESCDNLGSITIVKEGLEGDAAATFTHNVPDQGSDTFVLTALDNSETFEDLGAGSYIFTEEALEGWRLVSFGCDLQEPEPPMDSLVPTPEGQLTVVLGEGEDQVCTFVNEREPVDVTVLKYVDGALATEGAFDVTYTAGAEAPVDAQLMEPDWSVMAEIAFGESFSLNETGIDGTCDEGDVYRLAGYSMGADEAAAAAAELSDTAEIEAAEADATVIVWNQLCANLGSITILKNFEPDAEGVSQNFTTEGMGLEDFSIPEGTEQFFDNLSPGDYTFTEGPLPGWELDSVVCSLETGPADALIDLGGGSATVTLATGDNVVCTFTNEPDEDAGIGSITITKVWQDATGATIPGADTDFETSANLGAPNNTFTLSQGAATNDFGSLGADTYTFTESVPEGWTLFSIFCGPGIIDIDVDLEAGTLGVNLAEDQVITCTFTNREADEPAGEGSLTIAKVFEGGDPVTATFVASANLGDDDDSFTLDGTTTSVTFSDLADDTYVIDEADLEGWTVTNIVCTGGTNTLWDTDFPTGVLDVDLVDGENLTCTYTNTADAAEAGSLTIAKVFEGGDPVTATFVASANLGDDDDSFTLDGTTTSMTFSDLADDTYVIDEADLEGWTVTNIVCTGGTNTLWDTDFPTGVLDVDLVDGENLTCTYTNTADAEPGTGSIVLTKLWDGDDTGPNATFALSANLPDTDGTVDASVTLIDDGGNDDAIFSALGAGTYTFDEADIPDWDVTAITCDGVATAAVSNLADGTLVVTLAEGENALCTYTNTPDEDDEPEPGSGSILLTKLWEGDTAGPDAVFTLSANLGDADNSLTLIDDGANDDALFINLGVGTFTFAEQDIADWDVTAITCTGIPAASVTANAVAGTLSVTLADGQTASCTFTNAAATAVSPFFPELPNTNVPQPSVIIPNQPGVVSPNMPNQPGVASPNIPNQPGVVSPAPSVNIPNQPGVVSPEQPSVNIPNQPGVVSNSPLPSSVDSSNNQVPQTNVAGAQQPAPLPPSAGNTGSGSSDTAALGLWLVLAMLAGATGAVVYGLRRR